MRSLRSEPGRVECNVSTLCDLGNVATMRPVLLLSSFRPKRFFSVWQLGRPWRIPASVFRKRYHRVTRWFAAHKLMRCAFAKAALAIGCQSGNALFCFARQSRWCSGAIIILTHWNAWPATGRSALQDVRSCAILQASLRWAQCRPRSAAFTFGRVVHVDASTPVWCPVYHLHEHPQPGVVRSGLVSLPVVAARDQKWRVASDKSGLLSLLRQFG